MGIGPRLIESGSFVVHECTAHPKLASCRSPHGYSPISTSHLILGVLGLQTHSTMPGFYMDPRGFELRALFFTLGDLDTEPSPQTLSSSEAH